MRQYFRNPEDELSRLENEAALGNIKAQEELRSLRRNRGLCQEHGLSECSAKECQPQSLKWDESEILEEQARFLQEVAREEGDRITLSVARDLALRDQDHFLEEWESLCENLTKWMEEINPNSDEWNISGENLGWRRAKGSKQLQAKTGKELLQGILPKTDCTFTIYRWPNERKLKIVNSHHDAIGEIYWIKPAKFEESRYRYNPDELENLANKLEIAPSTELRLEYLKLQRLRGMLPDISILTHEDVQNQEITNFLHQNIPNLSFGNQSLLSLIPRFKLVIINYAHARLADGRDPLPADFNTDSRSFNITRLGLFPESPRRDGISSFKVIVVYSPPIIDEEEIYPGSQTVCFEIPYKIEKDRSITLPFENCYICKTDAEFVGLDTFVLPDGLSELQLQVSPPDYLSPRGDYGLGSYSEASMHYGTAGHTIVWYSLYATAGNVSSVGVCARVPWTRGESLIGSPSIYRYLYAGLERPTSLLPDQVRRQLSDDNYHFQMPSITDSLEQNFNLENLSPKILGFRSVYVRCQNNELHQFPFFLWRIPGELHSYPLIGRSLTDLDKDFIRYNGEVIGFDLSTI